MFGVGVLAIFDLTDTANLASQKQSGDIGQPVRRRIGLSDSFRNKTKSFFKHPAYWGYMLIFLPILFSGLYSEDLDYWLTRIRIKLPFLGLPLAYFLLPRLTAKEYRGIAIFYIVALLITALGVFINYLLNFDAINVMISQGQNIPVPRNHIRFSLGIAIAIILSIGLVFDRNPVWKWQKHIFIIIGILLFIFQHLLAVRSGLLGLYVGLIILIGYAILHLPYRKVGVMSLVLIIFGVLFSIKVIPSLRTKIGYMKYDWQMRKAGKGNNYSDSGRILSMQLALELGKKNRAFGVGAGDIKNEMSLLLRKHNHPKDLLPHNEYLFYYASTGLIGLGVFLVGIGLPIFSSKHYENVLFLAVQAILLSSFLTEATIENSTGVGYFLLWSLLGLKGLKVN